MNSSNSPEIVEDRCDFLNEIVRYFGSDFSNIATRTTFRLMTLSEERLSLLKENLSIFQTMDEVIEWLDAQPSNCFSVDPELFEAGVTSTNLHTTILASNDRMITASGGNIQGDGVIAMPNGLICKAQFCGTAFLGFQYFHKDGTLLLPGEKITLDDGTEICQKSLD